MKTVFYDELRRCCREIQNDCNNSEMIDKVIEAFHRSVVFSNGARKEGLLFLEEMSKKLDLNDVLQAFLHQQMILVVDGMNPDDVLRVGMNCIVANSYESYKGLIALLYLEASLEIQAGTSPRVFEELLKSLMPDVIQNKLMLQECKNKLLKEQKEAEKEKNNIDSLCADDTVIDEKDHSLINQTTLTLLELSDRDMRRVLRDTDKRESALAMKGLPGKARKRFFDNLSPNLGVVIADDMEFMGPVRMRDVEEACLDILRTIMKLEESGEIATYDFAVLKVVIDMHDLAQRKNNELKERYKELHRIIEDLYKS